MKTFPKPADIIPIQKRRKRSAYQNCFGTDSGRIVLKDLYDQCHAMQTTNVPGDPHHSAYLEGQRSVFVYIFKTMKVVDERKLLKQLEETRDE